MTVLQWASDNWPTLIQNLGIIGGLLFSGYSAWKSERSRKIGNLISVTAHYREIWSEFYAQPQLARVLEKTADLVKLPVTRKEELFVNTLFLHLDVVRRATKIGMFFKLDGIRKDVREFMSLPIPRAVFEKNKPFQDKDFTKFVESCLATV